MPIPREITAEEYGALEASDKELYEAADDGYKLLFDSAPALLRAKEHEAAQTKKARAELRALQQRIKDLEAQDAERANAATEDLKKKGAYKEYEERLRAKHQAELAAKDEAIKHRDAQILGKAVSDKAVAMATKISTVPDLLADKIAQQIGAEYAEDGSIDLYVKDELGRRGVESVDSLADKFKNDVRYKKVIVDTLASGGDTPSVTSGSNAAQSGAFPARIGGSERGSDGSLDYTSCTPAKLADQIDKIYGDAPHTPALPATGGLSLE